MGRSASRFTVLCRIEDKRAEIVTRALVEQMGQLPARLRKILTWDPGAELSAHRHFDIATNMVVCFCDPGSPWQRGTNENTNGLLRQYFPNPLSAVGCFG
ncbi:IS30 family transposase [Achromobacter sp. HZ34]|uniref:IS30 family transposase n=1 Tax=unclassified Achromobacter TaxID=2626865 RepID=UPI0035115FE5